MFQVVKQFEEFVGDCGYGFVVVYVGVVFGVVVFVVELFVDYVFQNCLGEYVVQLGVFVFGLVWLVVYGVVLMGLQIEFVVVV